MTKRVHYFNRGNRLESLFAWLWGFVAELQGCAWRRTYFWLLQQAIDRASAAGGNPSLLREARRLLVIPEDSTDLTHFTADPRPLLTHWDRIARMIEQLHQAGNRNQ